MPSFRKQCTCIPQRLVIAILGFFAFFNAYTLRVCLSIAITKMVVPLNVSDELLDETCPEYDSAESPKNASVTTRTVSSDAFEWSEHTQGIILSSFYWGYAITNLPGGLISSRFGAKNTIGFGVLITAILTVITPLATQLGDAGALVVIRFLMGLSEGVIQPAMSGLLAHWLPPLERSKISSIVYNGVRMGILVSSVGSGFIIGRSTDDWPLVFYVFGGLGLLWFVFWTFLAYDTPAVHPLITDRERRYLHAEMSSHTRDKAAGPFPWRRALTSRPFIALVISNAGQDWTNYTVMSDLPKYMHSVLKLPVQLNGYASSMYNMSSWAFSVLMCWISDSLIESHRLSRTNVRKINVAISTIGPASLLLLAVYVGCDVFWAVSFITLGLTLAGSSVPGSKVNVLDLSPNYAGELMGISNGIGAINGIIAPYLVGVLAPNQTLTEWKLIFWIVTVNYLITTAYYLIFGSGDVQPWNDQLATEKDGKKDGNPNENLKLLRLNENA